MKDKISIVVPVYNLEGYIERTLDSILQQTYQNIEIIVVNDGSADNTGTIADLYAKEHPERIRVFHIPNGGVTNARLTGVKYASGDWIGFVDGDDVIEPDMYERLHNNAIAHEADISHCGYQMVFPDGRIHYFYNSNCIFEQNNAQGQRDLLDGAVVEPGLWNKLYKRELFSGIREKMDLSVKINEDLLMNFFLFQKSKRSVFEDVCPYHYLVRETSVSRQKLNFNKIYDPIRVRKEIIEHADASIREAAQAAYLTTCVNVYNSVICTNNRSLFAEKRTVRNSILKHKQWIPLLRKKTRVLANGILYFPVLYLPVYLFYSRFLQTKKYD